MSTRSDIIVQCRDGKFRRVYCHFDGYLAGVGAMLQANYTTQEKCEALVAPGDISSLAENCDGAPGHSFGNRVDGQTTYYGRDRGESDVAACVFDTPGEAWPEADTWTEFTYLWLIGEEGVGAWWVGDADEGSQMVTLLSLALADVAKPHPRIKVPFAGITLGRHA